jgi:hypothetical protein
MSLDAIIGKYLPPIARVDSMVINFGVKNVLWDHEIAFQSWHSKNTK